MGNIVHAHDARAAKVDCDDLCDICMLASQGEAIATAVSLEETIECLSTATMQVVVYDLSSKFAEIKSRLEALQGRHYNAQQFDAKAS